MPNKQTSHKNQMKALINSIATVFVIWASAPRVSSNILPASCGTPVGAQFSTAYQGYTGSSFVENIFGLGNGLLGLKFEMPAAAQTQLMVRYAMGPNGPSGIRSLGVVVNGARQAQMKFTSTGNWSQWSTAHVTVALVAGLNKIDLIVHANDTGYVNIDYARIASATPVCDEDILQPSCGTPVGAQFSTAYQGYSGRYFLENIFGLDNGLFGLKFETALAVQTELTVRYAMGPNGPSGIRSLGVVVNGVRQAQLKFTSTGSWSQWSTTNVMVALVAGLNRIDLIVQAGDTGYVNIDYTSISSAKPICDDEIIQVSCGTPVGTQFSTDYQGYTGSNFLHNIFGTGNGLLGLKFVTLVAVQTPLTVRYAMGSNGPSGIRSLGVVVNGARQTQLKFISTGSWSQWSQATVMVALTAGLNKIDLIVQTDDTGYVNIDYARLSSAKSICDDEILQESCGTSVGAQLSTEYQGYTGTNFLQYIYGRGNGLFGLVFATSTALQTPLIVRYAMGPNGPSGIRSLGVVVNGIRQAQMKFSPTGSWSQWSEATVKVTLVKGINKIDLVVQSGDTGYVNVDYARIASARPICESVPWAGPFSLPHIPAAGANLPNGGILTWSAAEKYVNVRGAGQTFTCIFDPDLRECSEKLVQNTNHDMFCPGTAVLPDTRIFITGGTYAEHTSIYDPRDDSWIQGPNLIVKRGYHSMTGLPDGSVFTLGGSWNIPAYAVQGSPVGNRYGEVWNIKTNSWSLKAGINATGSLNTNDAYGLLRSDNHMWLFTAPNGLVFHAGPSTRMHWINPYGSQGSVVESIMRGDDLDAMTGNAVMYDIGKILTFGGAANYDSGVASNRAYVIDINGPEATVERAGNMAYGRTYLNSAVLPSGEIVVIGGMPNAALFSNANAVLEAEIWNPVTKQFRPAGKMKVPRAYHSMAILMKDGRIFAAGGGLCGGCSVNHADGEIFTPPYLLNANMTLRTRPVIQNISDKSVAPGQGFTVQVGTDTNHSFALVRLSAVTHSTNNDLRRIPLSVLFKSKNMFTLQLPSNGNVALPGTYWLYAMDPAGTPSVGETITVVPV